MPNVNENAKLKIFPKRMNNYDPFFLVLNTQGTIFWYEFPPNGVDYTFQLKINQSLWK